MHWQLRKLNSRWLCHVWHLILDWFREEQEKLNVWVALLNLENMYGTEESLRKVFERAVMFCEPMPVYQQLADIYASSNKIKVRPQKLPETSFLEHESKINASVSCIYTFTYFVFLLAFYCWKRRQRASIRRWWSAFVRIRQSGWAMGPSCSSRVTVMLPVLSSRGHWRVFLPKKVRWLFETYTYSVTKHKSLLCQCVLALDRQSLTAPFLQVWMWSLSLLSWSSVTVMRGEVATCLTKSWPVTQNVRIYGLFSSTSWSNTDHRRKSGEQKLFRWFCFFLSLNEMKLHSMSFAVQKQVKAHFWIRCLFSYIKRIKNRFIGFLLQGVFQIPASYRELFDRVIHLSVSVKKIKFFFKRYLEYEKKHGTAQSIQAVKEKAMEFVEAKGSEHPWSVGGLQSGSMKVCKVFIVLVWTGVQHGSETFLKPVITYKC